MATPPTAPDAGPREAAQTPSKTGFRLLDHIEWLGNKLPEPAILFAILAALVVVVSGIGSAAGWKVQPVQPRLEMVEKLDASGRAVLLADGKPKLVPKLDERGRPVVTLVETGKPIEPRSLVTVEGVYWMLSSMVRNFTGLPALGLVFVAMLGIGLAEKFGLFSALMRFLATLTPRALLTPVIVFIGASSSVASDAGYIVLPPLAAALYLAVGRHPVAGLAAAFAGVAGGFGGGLFPTAADGFLAGVATNAAHIIDPAYPSVQAVHNQYFKMGSAVLVMLAGWVVTDLLIEPRLRRQMSVAGAGAGEAGAGQAGAGQAGATVSDMSLNRVEKRGLAVAGLVAACVLGSFAAMVLLPGAPLHGVGMPTLASGNIPSEVGAKLHTGEVLPGDVPAQRTLLVKRPEVRVGSTPDAQGNYAISEPGWMVEQLATSKPRVLERPGDRWSHVIVPLIFLMFLLPGMAYGWVVGTLRTQLDVVKAIYHGVELIIPVLTIAFFMGQFVNYFTYSGLDQMLAYAGGRMLVDADMPVVALIVLFVLLVIAGDFAISGMLSKFGVLAPIFIPMFMMVGMSPELTTAAYRIGDSVVNIITPLNSYLLIILAVLQRYRPKAGLGSLISLMLPYSVVFAVAWTGFLLLWYALGIPLGPDAPLNYVPPQ